MPIFTLIVIFPQFVLGLWNFCPRAVEMLEFRLILGYFTGFCAL